MPVSVVLIIVGAVVALLLNYLLGIALVVAGLVVLVLDAR